MGSYSSLDSMAGDDGVANNGDTQDTDVGGDGKHGKTFSFKNGFGFQECEVDDDCTDVEELTTAEVIQKLMHGSSGSRYISACESSKFEFENNDDDDENTCPPSQYDTLLGALSSTAFVFCSFYCFFSFFHTFFLSCNGCTRRDFLLSDAPLVPVEVLQLSFLLQLFIIIF